MARCRVAQVKMNLFHGGMCTLAGVVIVKAAQGRERFGRYLPAVVLSVGIGTILDMDLLEIDVDVNEVYICHVKVNMLLSRPIEVVLTAYPDGASRGVSLPLCPRRITERPR